MARKYKKPARYVVDLFGGIRPLAKAIRMSPGSVHHWLKKGLIPRNNFRRILSAAARRKLSLTEGTLLYGGDPRADFIGRP